MDKLVAVGSNDAKDDTVEEVDDKKAKSVSIHKFSRESFVATEIVSWID